MRIAHFIHGLGLGGAQKVIASIVRGRRRQDLRYFVYTAEDGVLRQEVEAAGATVRVLPRHLPKLDPPWALRLARALRQDRIELVHTHLFGDTLHGWLAARLAGRVPVVMTLHLDLQGLPALQRWGYRRLAGRAERAVACSGAVASSYLEAGVPGAEEIVTIANGIEDPALPEPGAEERAALRQSLGAGPDDLLLAGIGRLAEQKGYRYLFAALARLRETAPNIRLVLLGEGPLRAELERRAEAEGVADRVTFAGFRPDVSALLPVLDVVVFSSLYEGLPVAVLEAMAARRPIVSTAVPGMVEAVRDRREALIVPIADASALAEALVEVAASPELRARLGKGARQRFLEAFTAERMVESYEALYRELEGRELEGRELEG